jgi:50S ribosomal protein L16 3-hydroxylase
MPNKPFDSAHFLSEYWQKKPVVIRDFFDSFEDFAALTELQQLAQEPAVESRLVRCTEDLGYQLQQGPFMAVDLPSSQESGWTLLIQAAELWIPELQQLIEHFNFLPRWRIDDIMMSYAASGGGVGPHFDQYDVFLVHGAGQRRWRLGPKIAVDVASEALLTTDSGLRLLRKMEVEQEVTLTSGDVLYIPPGYAHWGVGITPGFCYSVGFRAPSRAEMIEGFSDRLMVASIESNRFTDVDGLQVPDNSEITPAQWQNAWQSLHASLDDPQAFLLAFGCLVTAPKYPELIETLAEPVHAEELMRYRDQGIALVRNPASRLVFAVDTPAAEPVLFVDGETYPCTAKLVPGIRKLCAVSPEDTFEIADLWAQEAGQALLCKLVQEGALWLAEAED